MFVTIALAGAAPTQSATPRIAETIPSTVKRRRRAVAMRARSDCTMPAEASGDEGWAPEQPSGLPGHGGSMVDGCRDGFLGPVKRPLAALLPSPFDDQRLEACARNAAVRGLERDEGRHGKALFLFERLLERPHTSTGWPDCECHVARVCDGRAAAGEEDLRRAAATKSSSVTGSTSSSPVRV